MLTRITISVDSVYLLPTASIITMDLGKLRFRITRTHFHFGIFLFLCIMENEVTRCICNSQEDDGKMIGCDACGVWQHIECLGLKKMPKTFYCDQCAKTMPLKKSLEKLGRRNTAVSREEAEFERALLESLMDSGSTAPQASIINDDHPEQESVLNIGIEREILGLHRNLGSQRKISDNNTKAKVTKPTTPTRLKPQKPKVKTPKPAKQPSESVDIHQLSSPTSQLNAICGIQMKRKRGRPSAASLLQIKTNMSTAVRVHTSGAVYQDTPNLLSHVEIASRMHYMQTWIKSTDEDSLGQDCALRDRIWQGLSSLQTRLDERQHISR